ncbi:hypothetical protein H6G76_35875 [Nostoc sp. FACHB-152]|uniref:hypothetical protein n=1 Tax=unclassified Nostoc TaxID=2593658 RepID=UPI001688446C|nr:MULTISPECIES: hypothetical protein [unclassified Nostoc]MBD2452387.1 hypothetical protein [Nostoc sp. FACHB-152]MBD2473296.1 hypothetical protein [Nostoc sp. FACHB-145]
MKTISNSGLNLNRFWISVATVLVALVVGYSSSRSQTPLPPVGTPTLQQQQLIQKLQLGEIWLGLLTTYDFQTVEFQLSNHSGHAKSSDKFYIFHSK